MRATGDKLLVRLQMAASRRFSNRLGHVLDNLSYKDVMMMQVGIEAAPMLGVRASPAGAYLIVLVREAPCEIWMVSGPPASQTTSRIRCVRCVCPFQKLLLTLRDSHSERLLLLSLSSHCCKCLLQPQSDVVYSKRSIPCISFV